MLAKSVQVHGTYFYCDIRILLWSTCIIYYTYIHMYIIVVGLSSDLKKSTVVDESLSVFQTNVLFWRILQLLYGNSTEWEMYISIHMYVCVYVVGMYTFRHVYRQTGMSLYMYAYISVCIYAYMYVCRQTCIYVCVSYICILHTCMHTYICMYMCIYV